MTEFEQQLRADLQDLASTAPTTTRLRLNQPSMTPAAHPLRRGWLTPVLAATACLAAIGVAIGASYLFGANEPAAETNSAAPTVSSTVVQPDEETQRAVAKFLEEIQAQYGSKVSLATDWEEATILVGVAPPVPDELLQLDGESVAELRVDVFPASVTVSQYEAFVRAVGRAEFPGKRRVCAFSLAPDSAAITVNVVGLDEMTPAASADLKAQLETFTDAHIVMSQAPELASGSACMR